MEIRFLNTNDDKYEISNIFEESWKKSYKGIIPDEYLEKIPKGNWAAGLTEFMNNNLICIEGGKAVGCCTIAKSRYEKYKEYGEIIAIYLLPEYMKKGFGTKLIEKALFELKNRGYNKVFLWVLEDNTNARLFYSKCGFICNGDTISCTIEGKELHEICYEREI